MAASKSASKTQTDSAPTAPPVDDKPQTKSEARTLDAEVALPEAEQEKQGTGQGTHVSDPAEQQHVSGMDPNLANLVAPDKLTGDMKKDAQEALRGA